MAFTKATYDYLDSGGLINWQLTAKTSAFTAVSGEGYLVDTSSAAITVTLPTSPSAGDEIIIVDYASNAGTNNIIIDPGSLNLRGATIDLVLDNDDQTARLLYSGATKGWLVTTEAAAATPVAVPALTVDYLVVAGGGGAASRHSSGGGAGGLRTSYGSTSGGGAGAESALDLTTNTDYTVTVGTGGAGAGDPGGGPTASFATGGNNSVFDTITSIGGGRGVSYNYSPNNNDGGSGGGGSWNSGPGGSGTSGQGFAGGASTSATSGAYGGGGGGGASQTGYVGTTSIGGNGGAGLSVSITGSAVTYAGGGGGGRYNSGGSGIGGSGGGGNGGSLNANATSGSSNTGGGGGGGGGNSVNGGNGGSGVVILRYPDAYTISETTSPTVLTFTTDESISGEKVTTFTAGANGTIQFST